MIIVTGAAGFIGSHIVDALGKNHRLLLVDKPQHFRDRGYVRTEDASMWDWAQGKDRSDSPHKIIDRDYFLKVLDVIGPTSPKDNPKAKEHVLIPAGDKIEYVVHYGACTDTGETRKDFLEEWNTEYTKSIWNWCTKHQVPLVFASSAATYGAGENGFKDDWETTLKLKPLNLYGQSKQDFDVWLKDELDAGRPTPPHWYGLKFFNVYGPREAHKGHMVGPVLIAYRHILRHGSCRLFKSHNPKYKDGEQSRDFIHVNDIVALTEFLIEREPASGLYNCGTGNARTFLSMMEALFSSLKMPMKIEWIDTPERYRAAYQYFTEADMSRFQAAGYQKPFMSLEDGVASYVDWLKANDTAAAVEPAKFQ